LARLSALIPFVVVSSLAACAPSGPSRTTPRSSDQITSAEIATSGATDAFALIERLRPSWLRTAGIGSIGGGGRTKVVVVYLDGQRYGDLESLHSLNVDGIRSLQWLDAVQAATVLNPPPSDPIAGAIMIKTQ
jgi:hypothetical protein